MKQQLEEFKHQREIANAKILDQIRKDSLCLKKLADNMAECATNIHGQGYTLFLDARDEFLNELANLEESYRYYLCS